MLVHPTSRGLDPARLEAGRDLVLDIDPAHGLDLPDGVLADDLLDQEARGQIARGGLPAMARCREVLDASLTVDGLCLPWLWEMRIERAIVTMLGQAAALERAVRRHEPGELVLVGADDRLRRSAGAVAARAQIAVSERPGATTAAPAAARMSATVLRRRALRASRELGVPSRLRPGSVVFDSYWPLMALLDRMIEERGRRPAVMLTRLPTGPRRSVRAALGGGWVGTPGPAARRRAERAAGAALTAAERIAPAPLQAFELELGAAAHAETLAVLRAHAAQTLATAATLRLAFAGARPASIVSAWDGEPVARLTISLAQAAGIRTLVLGHGAFLLPQTLVDMDVCDEPLLWSKAVAPPISERGRPVRVVGYPESRAPAPPTKAAPRERAPRVLVLAQPSLGGVGLTSPRIAMRQYEAAVAAVLEAIPRARIVLRPHPSGGPATERALTVRFPRAHFEIDSGSSIFDALAASDLCIGTITTATLQAALVGTPVIALNVMGFEWRWPLGGDTTVPVANDRAQLLAWLERWSAGEPLPGRKDLLAALGADIDGDPIDRMLAILDER